MLEIVHIEYPDETGTATINASNQTILNSIVTLTKILSESSDRSVESILEDVENNCDNGDFLRFTPIEIEQ